MTPTYLICPYCNKKIILEHSQLKILRYLNKEGISNEKNIRLFLNLSHPTVIEHLNNLITKGYIKKQKMKIDGQRKEFKISVTEKGKNILYSKTSKLENIK